MNMFQLKVIAVIAMLIDHFGLIFFPQSIFVRVVGRVAFPIFAWLIANGARHTRSVDAYLERLCIFATISQIPYYLGYYVGGQYIWFHNVIFTLFLGLLAIRFIRASEEKLHWIAATFACALLAWAFNTDYAALGVLSIVAFYIFFNNPLWITLSQTIIIGILPWAFVALDGAYHLSIWKYYYSSQTEIFGLIALPIIFLYNGKSGPRAQFFFYWFFPLQAFAILGIKLVLHLY